MNPKSFTTSQWLLIGIGALLMLAIFSPQTVSPVYTGLGLVNSLVSLAFYGLGAIWFYTQLTKKD